MRALGGEQDALCIVGKLQCPAQQCDADTLRLGATMQAPSNTVVREEERAVKEV